MANWLDRLTGGGKTKSANSAKERLKLVLIHDRMDISPQDMEDMKNELLKVISRYVDIDPRAVRIDMQQEGREQRLIADIPIKVISRRRVG
jgi:cell division topological specificity factor